MPSRFERYRMSDGRTPLGERYFNAIWRDIDLRIATLEDVKIAWQLAVDEVVRFGLVRIDDLIREPLQEVAALSAQATATSEQLDQLRALTEARTHELLALIASLETSTQEQVSQFINDTTTAAAADITAWKAARVAELEAWVQAFEQAMQQAQQQLAQDVAQLQAGIDEASSRFRVLIEANGAVGKLHARRLIHARGAIAMTFAAAATLGNGWWCQLRNAGAADVTLNAAAGQQIDGQASITLLPGMLLQVLCDGATLRTVVTRRRDYGPAQIITAKGVAVVPADTYVIRAYAFGRGGDAGVGPCGGGGGCAFGDMAVTPGQVINLDIAAGIARVLLGGVSMLTANPAVGVTPGTATKHANVLRGGAYPGGAGRSAASYVGGASSGSPLGPGLSSSAGYGAGWGSAGAAAYGGGAGLDGSGLAAHSGITDPLLIDLTAPRSDGAHGGPGAGGGGATKRGGFGGGGGGGGGTSNPGAEGGFGGGGGGGYYIGGLGGLGGGGGGNAVNNGTGSPGGAGGAAAIVIFWG